ncbi:hypothetical protein M9Y10_029243 [Tritrichomonas musculus]|uniref:TPR Domain containing protein n=1 Tax=Tritrichomonas musculus TaxID=1915356 RepID=A0ABR2KMG4_9EUKA
MSTTRNRPMSDLNRSTQRKTITATKLKQKDLDGSSHRLSRIPNKFTVPKTAKIEQPESYAISYFNNNPDVPLDKRSPLEKLDEINSKINDDELDDNDLFNLLVQRKSLTFLAYGENSPQCFEALRELGHFYNRQNRPESALRHLLKAQQINSPDITNEGRFSLSIELAEAYLAKKASKEENSKQLNNAEKVLSSCVDVDVEDKMLVYKRDLLLARIKSRRNKYNEALSLYEQAIDSLNDANDGRKCTNTASLYLEIGTFAESSKDMKTAGRMYKNAYDTFIELNMTDAAKIAEEKIPANYEDIQDDNDEQIVNQEDEGDDENVLEDTVKGIQDSLIGQQSQNQKLSNSDKSKNNSTAQIQMNLSAANLSKETKENNDDNNNEDDNGSINNLNEEEEEQKNPDVSSEKADEET